jgi:hypothetical protein
MTRTAWMRARTIALTGLALTAAHSASAGFILSDFSAADDGWTSNVDCWQTGAPRAGNASGWLQVSGDGSITPEAWASSSFLGDQSHARGGTFSFLANVVEPQLSHSLDRYIASVTFFSGADSVTIDFAPIRDLVRSWGLFEVDMTAAAFGMGNGEFSDFIGDLTGITISLDTENGATPFDVGFDEIILTPTPGAAMLLGLAAPALLRRRR